jgi:hypothetical protein
LARLRPSGIGSAEQQDYAGDGCTNERYQISPEGLNQMRSNLNRNHLRHQIGCAHGYVEHAFGQSKAGSCRTLHDGTNFTLSCEINRNHVGSNWVAPQLEKMKRLASVSGRALNADARTFPPM